MKVHRTKQNGEKRRNKFCLGKNILCKTMKFNFILWFPYFSPLNSNWTRNGVNICTKYIECYRIYRSLTQYHWENFHQSRENIWKKNCTNFPLHFFYLFKIWWNSVKSFRQIDFHSTEKAFKKYERKVYSKYWKIMFYFIFWGKTNKLWKTIIFILYEI